MVEEPCRGSVDKPSNNNPIQSISIYNNIMVGWSTLYSLIFQFYTALVSQIKNQIDEGMK